MQTDGWVGGSVSLYLQFMQIEKTVRFNGRPLSPYTFSKGVTDGVSSRLGGLAVWWRPCPSGTRQYIEPMGLLVTICHQPNFRFFQIWTCVTYCIRRLHDPSNSLWTQCIWIRTSTWMSVRLLIQDGYNWARIVPESQSRRRFFLE